MLFVLLYVLPLLSQLFCSLFFSTSFLANNMNNYRYEDSSCCYIHPKEVVVGVCALCLRERLLTLASKQGHLPISKDSNKSFRVLRRRPAITLPKVFALGSFLHRFESRRQRPDDDSDQGSITSLEDSFISIKFEENGQASWERKKQEMADQLSKEINRGKSVVEHVKPRGVLQLRKRIGQLLHMSRWRRSSKAGASHVGLPSKVEGRRGWMRSLTRRRIAD